MAQLPVAVIESIAAHHGVIDRASFVEHGVSLHQINRRIESGRLVRMHYGVYRSAEWPDSERARCVAACLAATDGAISHMTAARLWNLGAAPATPCISRSRGVRACGSPASFSIGAPTGRRPRS